MADDTTAITVGPGLTARVHVDGARARLRLHGEIDLAVADDLERLVAGMTAAVRRVDLDLGEVSFIDPRGARLLVTMTPAGGRVGVTALSPSVERVLRIAYPDHPLGRDGSGPSGPGAAPASGRTLRSRRRDDPRAVVHPTGRLPMTDSHAGDSSHSHEHEHGGATHAHEHASHDHDHVEHAHVHEHASAGGTTEHEHGHVHDPAVAQTHEHPH